MLSRYGTSGYLQLLDNEPTPLESRKEKLRTRGAEKKQFLEQLKIKQLQVKLDLNYGQHKGKFENSRFRKSAFTERIIH